MKINCNPVGFCANIIGAINIILSLDYKNKKYNCKNDAKKEDDPGDDLGKMVFSDHE